MMRFVSAFFAVALIGCSQAHIQTNGLGRIYEDQLNGTLECIRDLLNTGLEEHNIPTFNPLTIEHLTIDFASFSEQASGLLNLNNIVIEGITGWDLEKLKIDLNIIGGLGATIKTTLNIPILKLNTEYNVDVNVAGIHVFGDGTLTLEIGNFGIDLDTKALLSRVTMNRFEILPSITDFNAKFTGFMNSEEESALVNQILNEVAVRWVNEKSQDISDMIGPIVMDLVNNSGGGEAGEGGEGSDGDKSIIEIILEQCPLTL